MIQARSPLIVAGQIYLHEALDEYLIVTKNNRGQIFFKGAGFGGQAEDQTFIDWFPPVDPEDVDPDEVVSLLELCPPGTTAKVGFIMDESTDEEEPQ